MLLHVAIEASAAISGGAARVLVGVTEAFLLNHASVRDVTVFVAPKNTIELPLDKRLSIVEANVGRTNLGRISWQRYGLRRAVARSGASVLLSLSNSGDAPDGVALVTLVHTALPFSPDAIALLPVHQKVRTYAIRHQIKRAIASSDAIIVQTETMRSCLLERYQGLVRRIEVIPPPAQMFTCGRTAKRAKFSILYVGNDSAYKNLPLLLCAMRQLKSRIPEARLTATVSPMSVSGYGDVVDGVGYVGDDALANLYQTSTCFVMPSLAETVCLPLLEAMAAGLPIVAADRPYSRDVCGPAALYYEAGSAESLSTALLAVLTEKQKANCLTESGFRRVRRHVGGDYSRIVDLVIDVLKRRSPQDPQLANSHRN